MKGSVLTLGGTIEKSFRELKSGLDLRPVYAYKDSRVRGHVMICFLALLLESTFRSDLMLDLKQVRSFELKLNDKHYLLRSVSTVALSSRR